MPNTSVGNCLSCFTASPLQMGNLSGNTVVLEVGAICPGSSAGGRLFTRNGFWRSAVTSVNFYPCAKEGWCLGAHCNYSSSSAQYECAEHDSCTANRRGVLCWDCAPGFGSNDCIPCPEAGTKWFLVTLAGIVTAAGLLYCQMCAQRPDMPKTVTFLIDHCQLLSIVSSMSLSWSCLMRQALSWLSLEGFSISAVFGSACALAMDWQQKLMLMAFSPLLLVALGCLAVALKRAVRSSSFTVLEEVTQMTQVVVVLTHSSLTAMSMAYFATEEFDRVEHLRSNISMPANDPKHEAVFGFAVFMLVYACAVPVLFSAALVALHYHSPETLTDRHGGCLYHSLGSLYAKQKSFTRSRTAPLWEAVRLVRKMVLNAIVVFETVKPEAGLPGDGSTGGVGGNAGIGQAILQQH